jgi:hypothetical protein
MKVLPPANQNVMTKIKVFKKVKIPDQRYQIKGLARKNTHVKYESPSTYQLNVKKQG